MAIQNAQAKLYNAFIASVVDKNASAALVSTFKAGHQDPDNAEIILDDIKPLRILRNKFELLNSSTAVTAQGSFLIKGGEANLQTQGTLTLRFPTFVRIDIDKLNLPEGRNVTLQLEEGWLLEDQFKFPFAFGGPLPANANVVTFRVPKKLFALPLASQFTQTFIPLRIKQLSAPQLNTVSTLLALPIFNPGQLAALFGGNFVTIADVNRIAGFVRFLFIDAELKALPGFLLQGNSAINSQFNVNVTALEGLKTSIINIEFVSTLTANINFEASINLTSNSFASMNVIGSRTRLNAAEMEATSSVSSQVNYTASVASTILESESNLISGINYISTSNTVNIASTTSLEQTHDFVAIYTAMLQNQNTASITLTNAPLGGGGHPPINASIFWGDGTQNDLNSPSGIGQTFDKVYDQPGTYKILIRNNSNIVSTSEIRNVRLSVRLLNTAQDGTTFRSGFSGQSSGLRSVVTFGQIELREIWQLFYNENTSVDPSHRNGISAEDWFNEFTMIPDNIPVSLTNAFGAFASPNSGFLRVGNTQNFINLSNWDVSRITDFAGMFDRQSTEEFGNLVSNPLIFTVGQTWNTQSATNMFSMFNNVRFVGDLSNWCVPLIPTRPTNFSNINFAPNLIEPIWGTCP